MRSPFLLRQQVAVARASACTSPHCPQRAPSRCPRSASAAWPSDSGRPLRFRQVRFSTSDPWWPRPSQCWRSGPAADSWGSRTTAAGGSGPGTPLPVVSETCRSCSGSRTQLRGGVGAPGEAEGTRAEGGGWRPSQTPLRPPGCLRWRRGCLSGTDGCPLISRSRCPGSSAGRCRGGRGGASGRRRMRRWRRRRRATVGRRRAARRPGCSEPSAWTSWTPSRWRGAAASPTALPKTRGVPRSWYPIGWKRSWRGCFGRRRRPRCCSCRWKLERRWLSSW